MTNGELVKYFCLNKIYQTLILRSHEQRGVSTIYSLSIWGVMKGFELHVFSHVYETWLLSDHYEILGNNFPRAYSNSLA